MKPTKCPHCDATTNPLRLSLYSTRSVFRCSRCEKKSRFDRRSLGLFGGLAAFAGVLIQGIFHFEGITLLMIAAGATLALIAAMWFTLTLRPLDDKKA